MGSPALNPLCFIERLTNMQGESDLTDSLLDFPEGFNKARRFLRKENSHGIRDRLFPRKIINQKMGNGG